MAEETKHIVLKSGKNTITSVTDMVEINAAKDIHMSSKTGLKIDLGSGEKSNFIIVDDTNIILGKQRNQGEVAEPLVKGDQLENALDNILEVISDMASYMYHIAEESAKPDFKEMNEYVQEQVALIRKYKLPKIKSERNKTI